MEIKNLLNEITKLNEDTDYDKKTIQDAYYDLLNVYGTLNSCIFAIKELSNYYLQDFSSSKQTLQEILAMLETATKTGRFSLTSAEQRKLKSDLDSFTSNLKRKLDDRNLIKSSKDIADVLQLRQNIDKKVGKARAL